MYKTTPSLQIDSPPLNGHTWRPVQLLALSQNGETADVVHRYARYISRLLKGEPVERQEIDQTQMTLDSVAAIAQEYDLVVVGETRQSLFQQLLTPSLASQLVERLPESLLYAPAPRQPIRQILLVARAAETDQAAVSWMLRLAQASKATVTVLVVVPAEPGLYNFESRVQVGLDILLMADSPPGQHLRRTLRQMAEHDINGRLHLRYAEPDQQIRQEVTQGDYDLIIIAAEHRSRLHRWWLGELVKPLLRWADRPVLVAKPPLNKAKPAAVA